MIRRLLIATALLVSTLTGVAVQRVPRTRTLYVFTGPGPDGAPCGGCVAFDLAWRDPAFRRPLQSAISIRGPFDVRRHSAMARQFGVDRWPAFIVVDDGKIVFRAEGFKNTTSHRDGFLQSLGVNLSGQCENGVCSPISRPAPQKSDGVSEDVFERIQQANHRLENERDALRSQVRQLEQAARRDATAVQEAQREVRDTARKRAEREVEELRRQIALPSAPPFSPPDISAETSAGLWQSILKTGARFAIAAGLPEGTAAWVVPAVTAGGPAGAAGTVGLLLLRRWWRRRQQKGAAQPAGFPGRHSETDQALPRDNSEIEQILSLRQQEKREPLHDALFGVLFEDEYRANPDQSVKEAFDNANHRFNNIAPLSTNETQIESQSVKKG